MVNKKKTKKKNTDNTKKNTKNTKTNVKNNLTNEKNIDRKNGKNIQMKTKKSKKKSKTNIDLSKLSEEDLKKYIDNAKDKYNQGINISDEIRAIKKTQENKIFANNNEKDHIFEPYPEPSNKKFNKIILSKKEFYDTKIEYNKIPNLEIFNKEANKKCNKTSSNPTFSLSNSQEFLKRFMSVNTPYNGVMIFHGVGVGKTCAAVTIAEQFRQKISDNKKKIYILANQTIHQQWKDTIIDPNKIIRAVEKNISKWPQCTGNNYESKLGDIRRLQKESLFKLVDKIIKNHYVIMGYRQFANHVEKLKKKVISGQKLEDHEELQKNIIKEVFSDTVLILDEAHNIRTGEEMSKLAPPRIQEVIKHSDNLKLVLLSATPMYNGPKEIVFLLNLLLENDNRENISESMIFDKEELKPEGIEILKKVSTSYISYLRGENPLYFPIKLNPNNNILSRSELPILSESGKEISSTINYLKLYKDVMSPTHFIVYQNAVGNLDIGNNDNFEKKIESSIGSKELQLSNIFFPFSELDDLNSDISKYETHHDIETIEIDTNSLYGKNGFDKTFKTKTKQNGSKYFEFSNELKKNNHVNFLNIDKIGMFSSKIHSIINNIMDSEGIIYIYSNFIYGGVLPLALALEQNGISKFGGKDKQLLNSEDKKNLICYKCKKFEIDHIKGKTDHSFQPMCYSLLTGDKDITQDKSTEIDIITGKNPLLNKNGEMIKIIIGSSVTGEGLDFKRVREIHIMEPWFHLSKLEQINGRGIRTCSHIDLPLESRNVTVFMHTSINPSINNDSEWPERWETIDSKIYRIAELKAKRIGQITIILKENAVDCGLNFNGNVISGKDYLGIEYKDDILKNKITMLNSKNEPISLSLIDKPFSYICDWGEDCNYKCNNIEKIDLDKNEINYDTYNLSYAVDLVEKYTDFIKEIFESSNAKNIKQLIISLKQDCLEKKIKFDKLVLYKTLDDMVSNKNKIITRKNGDIGYLIYRGNYYIYQSLINKDTFLPLLNRSSINKTLRRAKFKIKGLLNSKKIVKKKTKITSKYLHRLYNYFRDNDNYVEKCIGIDGIEYDLLNQIIELIITILKNIDLIDTHELLTFLKDKDSKTSFINEFKEILNGYFIINTRDIYPDKKGMKEEIIGYKNYNSVTNNLEYYELTDTSDFKLLGAEKMRLINEVDKKKSKDNLGVIIGYIDGKKDNKKEKIFKYRETKEKRNIGAQCFQKKKPEIIELMKKIGVKITDKQKIEFDKRNIHGVCDEFEKMLRHKELDSKDGTKWFYRPYEVLPKK